MDSSRTDSTSSMGKSRARRRRTLSLVVGGVTVAAVVAGLPSAYAALAPVPPSSVLDLSTVKTFDTGAMMAKLCPAPRKRDYWTDVSFWFYDPGTGTVAVDPSNGVGTGDAKIDGDGMIDNFFGHCEYPVTEVKDDVGAAQQISRPLINCGKKVTLNENVTENFSTNSSYTTSVSVGGGFDFTVIKDVLSLSGNASVTQSWAFGTEHSISRTVAISVPPQTKGYFERVPVIRTIVSQPIFVLEYYSRINNQGERKLNGFEDTGTIRITSPAFRTNSAADALDADGFPSGTIRAQDDPVVPQDCD
jgi:hypothetical protein